MATCSSVSVNSLTSANPELPVRVVLCMMQFMATKGFAPAFCPVHGLFDSRAISWPANSNVTVNIKGSVINCPVCDRMCEIVPGEYKTDDNRLNILIDQSISLEALAALKNLAIQVRDGKKSPEEAAAEAQTIAPKAARLFDFANWSDDAKAKVVVAIIGAITAIAVARMSEPSQTVVNVTVNPVIESIIETEKRKLKRTTSSQTGRPVLPRPKPKRRR